MINPSAPTADRELVNKAKLPAPTAKQINEQHMLAKSCAQAAVEHAILCGQLLCEVKASLPHGDFEAFVTDKVSFAASTARKYMKAANLNALGVAFSSLQDLFTSSAKTKEEKSPIEPKRYAVAFANDSQQVEKPAVLPIFKAELGDPERPEDIDEEAAEQLARADYDERIEKAIGSDDRLEEAFRQIKMQSALIASITLSRNHYMNSQAEAVRLAKKQTARADRLQRELDGLRKRA